MVTKTQDEGLDPELRKLAIVVLLGAVMTILDTTIVNVAVKSFAEAFEEPLPTIQWVLTGYTLALSMSIPITGWAVARFGAKRMWILSLIGFVAGSALCGLAWNVTSLIVFRVLQGAAAGMIMPIGQTMLAQKAGPHRMGRVMAVIAVPAMLAPVLGPLLGGLLLDHLSWRWLFFINVPFCAVALAAAFRFMERDVRSAVESKLDWLGLLLLSPGLALVVFGMAEAGEGEDLVSLRVLGSALLGLLLITAFVLHAVRRGDRALVDVRLYRDRTFSVVNLAFLLYVAALFGMMVLFPLYYQVVHGFTPLKSGLMTAPMGLGAMITMALSGRLADRLGSRRLALTGLPIVLLGIFCYTQISYDTPIPVLLGILFLIGVGHGSMMPALMGGMYRTLSPAQVPSATAASNIGMRVGSSLGVAALAVLLQLAITDRFPDSDGTLSAVPADLPAAAADLFTSAFTHTFWWALGLAALALIPILLIPRPQPTAVATTPDTPADPVKDAEPAH
ncbi:EmrB/QacA subfamily drug resistance transporter [Actinocorallia herbida]|uniref:EmrB/QacA subfamily drug resistance transporter n=1 Tax=Actinocorallia herbida TaxID=58109 RepID=A0A3N1DBG8_9ACTN|nr:MDR family MFS transporter [Actinocorallia herbida]ROO90816.1 EmrB/QacA subfamily drug resistance transporter [Actinocorallia herbida]